MLAQRGIRQAIKGGGIIGVAARRWVHVEQRIKELGLELPPPAPPRANYNSICVGPGSNVVYVSGHLPFHLDGKTLTTGRIGEEGRDVDYGYQAARQVGLNLVATLQDQLGDLDRVEKVIKVRCVSLLKLGPTMIIAVPHLKNGGNGYCLVESHDAVIFLMLVILLDLWHCAINE